MRDTKDIGVGSRFTRLIIIRSLPGLSSQKSRQWLCLCDCGNKTVADSTRLKKKKKMSCGCLARQMVGDRNRTHGLSKTSIYYRWKAMLERCNKPDHPAYHNYGGRGIAVCKRWLRFENFFEDMGFPPSGLTLDRVDNNKGYSKKNCRWASMKDQANNTRRVFNKKPPKEKKKRAGAAQRIDGRTIAEWATLNGIKACTIYSRLKKGCNPSVAVSKPTLQPNERKHARCRNFSV